MGIGIRRLQGLKHVIEEALGVRAVILKGVCIAMRLTANKRFRLRGPPTLIRSAHCCQKAVVEKK